MKLIESVLNRLGYVKAPSPSRETERAEEHESPLAFSLSVERKWARGEGVGDRTSLYFTSGQLDALIRYHSWINAQLKSSGHQEIFRSDLLRAAIVIGLERMRGDPLLVLVKMDSRIPI